ncbi:MAG: hypothetical protein A2528_01250 [Candidatus Staskawiczbacteria bacterium RIFOXYD2_FULL_37_9]|uniref:Uncharacterized protein n=1 Tax=Candidatus Staskawiczbacteria bacterium RIFOXYB1_FULL_37_44 TaxID=1802223 RepID=A0A1G2IWA4_9BACT|nr:MAG: hypothetical protein A2358_03925 [Candidatus Staskawiczbacteria bacterium RIFOXYB1_FULL_37_44]OGZ83781.1 MAG: hypothetical protein A2416_00160 [Candidatus Staskawiczbacteria bacterium RIFOXYC1_FULL_37_52]OGZ88930.1 MAG: hypothetical protein A2581_01650 [Candidatus Staskawiczbacteria bacterium RIFOXYD1_FULL_37_110]OGZ89573.1 MAG: hypothetical protein A2444_01395 [Candidatus Staskawiczbacteria bacterium RIFOXYC2_FULL_37_19]OGZ94207.1 MAG: hypothetical protein A2528_01250 [Candidatus Stask
MNRSVANAQPISLVLSRKRIKKKVVAKKTVGEFFNFHIRLLLIELFGLIFNHDWIFWLIGSANRKLGLIKSVFLVYPATEEYERAYTYKKRAKRIEWSPWLVGLFWQNGKVGVKFAISSSNSQFVDPGNKEKLRSVAERMEKIRQLFRAEHKTFAGILPGVLLANRMVRKTPEADVTVEVVCQAIGKVKSLEGLGDDTPIIVLGGRGFIGRRVVSSLPKNTAYCVDIAGNNGQYAWPSHLQGRPVLLVNISLNSALGQYVHLLWPEVVILNEVYPEPSQELVERLEAVGSRCWHVAGVKAGALPSFPGGYQGGIPCCAAWQSDEMEVLLKKIV